jgi:hypothetical protein
MRRFFAMHSFISAKVTNFLHSEVPALVTAATRRARGQQKRLTADRSLRGQDLSAEDGCFERFASGHGPSICRK